MIRKRRDDQQKQHKAEKGDRQLLMPKGVQRRSKGLDAGNAKCAKSKAGRDGAAVKKIQHTCDGKGRKGTECLCTKKKNTQNANHAKSLLRLPSGNSLGRETSLSGEGHGQCRKHRQSERR